MLSSFWRPAGLEATSCDLHSDAAGCPSTISLEAAFRCLLFPWHVPLVLHCVNINPAISSLGGCLPVQFSPSLRVPFSPLVVIDVLYAVAAAAARETGQTKCGVICISTSVQWMTLLERFPGCHRECAREWNCYASEVHQRWPPWPMSRFAVMSAAAVSAGVPRGPVIPCIYI